MEQTLIDVKRKESVLYSSNGHYSTVQLLLNNNADINLCSKNGTSPLSIAYQNGDETTAQLLSSSGADNNLSAKDWDSPFCIDWKTDMIHIE